MKWNHFTQKHTTILCFYSKIKNINHLSDSSSSAPLAQTHTRCLRHANDWMYVPCAMFVYVGGISGPGLLENL